jgi:hypothetical protein
MKIRLVIACAAAMIMCVSGIGSGDEIIYSQNFDDLDDGDVAGQGGLELISILTPGIGSPTVQSKVALKGKAMQVDTFQEVYTAWPEPVETGTCYLSIFFRKEDVDPANTLHIYMGKGARAWSAGPVIRIGAQSGDPKFIGIHDGSDDNIVQAAKFEVGKWHHIREVVDVDNQTFDVYLDGEKLGNYKFRNAAHDTIDWLMIGFDEGIGTLGYYDAIEFGLGTGEGAFIRATPVEPAGKLSTTWATVKIAY